MPDSVVVPVETGAGESGPRLHATIIQEGRISRGGRRELFSPGALAWPAAGIAVRAKHHAAEETRAVPERMPDGRIVVDAAGERQPERRPVRRVRPRYGAARVDGPPVPGDP
ncbi:MAG: hypothetical protein F4137_10925 [Acidobacteria bacterium]|nr:hypothetical protein [Acidobacteriota bacterium]MYH29344.1 hypothetical protein [Acidobacteriota bacterium]